MPRLNAKQIRVLLEVLERTEDHELTCDECLPRLAELVEAELAGVQPDGHLDGVMRLVEAHLAICPECVEELDAIRAAIHALAEGG
ncbi:MAG: hypothetical protein AAF790_03855 [Planctomycetota bacterium]